MNNHLKIIETKVFDDYCLARIGGQYDSDESLVKFREIMHRCTDLNKTMVIIDVQEMEGEIPVVDRYQLGNFINEQQKPFIKIIFLARTDQTKPARVLETVANNRGSFVKVVTSMEEADEFIASNKLTSVM